MSFELPSSVPMPLKPISEREVAQRVNNIIDRALQEGDDMSPFVVEYFQDPDFQAALPEEILANEQVLRELMRNMAKFSNIIHAERQKRSRGDMSGMLAEEIAVAETRHADSRVRHKETGYRVDIEYLRRQGIDPSKVLFFRTTQPSSEPKPEYYWTSAYFETRTGLRQEIPTEQRRTAVTLVASLETINQNGGLITDTNDDSGLAVRQIGTEPFDQSLVLATIKPKR